MRFADGPRTDVQLTIDAPPDEVWTVVTDIALPAIHSGELCDVEWVEPSTHPELGARFRGRMDNGSFQWETVSEITVFDVPTRFEWTVEPMAPDEQPVATWGFELTPTERGGTVLRQHVLLGPGPSGLTMVIDKYPEREESIVAARLAQQAEAMMRNLEAVRARIDGAV